MHGYKTGELAEGSELVVMMVMGALFFSFSEPALLLPIPLFSLPPFHLSAIWGALLLLTPILDYVALSQPEGTPTLLSY